MEPFLYEKNFGERGLPFLNIGSVWFGTKALGPGLRAAIWVQGCPFHCEHCISPELIPDKQVHLITPKDVAKMVLSKSKITGLTISGGEPMLQAAGLAKMLEYIKGKRELNVICFTGCDFEHLSRYSKGTGIYSLLSEVDVLIDGQYISELDDNRGLRGSANQQIHYLTPALQDDNFEDGPRKIELMVYDTFATSIGVPPKNVTELIQQSFSKFNRRQDE